MKKALCFLILPALLSSALTYAGTPIITDSKVKISDTPIIAEGIDFIPAGNACFHRTIPNTDDPIGDVFILGTTWYECQHNSTCARQIQIDRGNWIHTAWMKGMERGAVNRHIYYNLVDSLDNIIFSGGGIQVDQSSRAGCCGLELYPPDNRALVYFHRPYDNPSRSGIGLAVDYLPRTGAFTVYPYNPWPLEPYDTDLKWPQMDIDRSNRMHFVMYEETWEGLVLHYFRAEHDTLLRNVNFAPQLSAVCTTATLSATVASSPVSDRTAAAWLEPYATNLASFNQHDNNLILCVSNDGLNWNWSDTVNVTHWIPPDSSLLPNTVWTNRDTFRCYAEINLLFDFNDVLHIFFTTEGYYHFSGTITLGNSFIWHWDEVNQVFSLVGNGWFEFPHFDPGAWNKYICRPSAGVDSVTGEIYCIYQRYNHPIGYSTQYPYPYLLGDTTYLSAAGWPNGEIWATKSSDGGLTWAEGTNITRTYTPCALPGECMSEISPSMAPDAANGCCHIFYILDRDAGNVCQTEGTWTLNDAVYQRVPLDSIAAEPLLPNYPMHCDSTGFAGVASPGSEPFSPAEFTLHPPYPNPFNQRSLVSFTIQLSGDIKLAVYDIAGREVAALAEGFFGAGAHHFVWDASAMPSGIYFVRLQAGDFNALRKMALVK